MPHSKKEKSSPHSLSRVRAIEIYLRLGNEKCLIPQLQPGNIIIIDNATFHKGQSVIEIVEAAGCYIWYLPPYSPDLNKIERWWSVLKTWMKQRIKEFETVRECVDAAFKQCPNVYA